MQPVSLSHLAPQLSRALQTWRPPGIEPDAFAVVSVPAPLAAPESVFAAGDSGAGFFWAPGQGTKFVAEGVAASVNGHGASRIGDVRRAVERLLGGVKPLEPGAPVPRVFGGFSFQPETPAGTLWNGFPAAHFVLPRTCYAREGDRAWISVSLSHAELSSPEHARRLIARSVAWLEGILKTAERRTGEPLSQRIQSVPDRAGWHELVRAIQREIAQGRFQKVVAARRAVCRLEPAPAVQDVLLRLAEIAGDCTRFAVQRGDKLFLGATPEWLIRKHGRIVTTEAMAGSCSSRRPGAARELLGSHKDLQEHALVVEEILGALGPLSADVRAPSTPEIRSLRDILHLYTPIAATLDDDAHVLELVERLHPTPAVGGAPRLPAERWIAQNESEERGWYASPLGWIDAAGDGQFVVALRSALLTGSVAHLFAGAGIVAESDPDLEFEETELKLAAMMHALGAG